MLFKDKDHATRTVFDPSFNEFALTMGEPKGIPGLGILGTGSANYAAKNAILRLTDFSGKKLRVNATAMEREKMRRLGATAVPLPLNEVMPSLQRGVIDGTMSGTAIFVAFKMNDVAKTMTVTNDTMLVSLAVVSKVFLDKLPLDLRKTVLDVGRETQKRTSDWEKEFSKGLDKAWVDQGGIMHQLPADDLKKMAELLNSVGDDVSKDQPAVNEMLKRVRAIAAKN
jgi:TRAP-type C4-dicarboxylate transport system substrate-binding protein